MCHFFWEDGRRGGSALAEFSLFVYSKKETQLYFFTLRALHSDTDEYESQQHAMGVAYGQITTNRQFL